MTPLDTAPSRRPAGNEAGVPDELHPNVQVAGMPPGLVLDEIMSLLQRLHPQTEARSESAGDTPSDPLPVGGTFGRAFLDTLRLFRGEYPGYQACNTLYHDLDHTLSVVLAMARLMHGAALAGVQFSVQGPELGVLAALFHDIGYIQREDDREGSGAKYTIGHEERGIAFLHAYLAQDGFTEEELADSGNMIRCTDLRTDCSTLHFHSEEGVLLGRMLGSADLLAQMADRRYLEKLFYLYREFTEADIPGFDSELDLLRKTQGFYEQVARKRLDNDFSGVADFMTVHFREMGQPNPYESSIRNNLNYLRQVLESWQDSFRDLFRRGTSSG